MKDRIQPYHGRDINNQFTAPVIDQRQLEALLQEREMAQSQSESLPEEVVIYQRSFIDQLDDI